MMLAGDVAQNFDNPYDVNGDGVVDTAHMRTRASQRFGAFSDIRFALNDAHAVHTLPIPSLSGWCFC